MDVHSLKGCLVVIHTKSETFIIVSMELSDDEGIAGVVLCYEPVRVHFLMKTISCFGNFVLHKMKCILFLILFSMLDYSHFVFNADKSYCYFLLSYPMLHGSTLKFG